ncbi:LamG-like jellyroll fold domain-containing protein, partial [Sphingorhabdus sp.]|uniref:LamG-like jellyroll fold domain-containing protein n=1 Tax=Sphingorhabdus sp. TaxID=1902408 RepID=UPI002FDAA960
MALIHYYKFNGNLYDSIGAFDLLADINTPVYVPGKLGGSTGAVTSSSASFYRFGCTGTGGAASGFMASDTTEAANGVLSWSMTGWVYLTSFSTQLIQLLTGTAGQSTATLGYDQKFGSLTFNGTSAACSSATWVFFAIRVTGGASYLSVNGGAESMTTWTTNMMAGGKSLFNGIRIGSPSAFATLYAYLDDVRVFNHSLSSGEIAGIYNGGSPAEATARTSNYKSTYRHFKFNSSLNDINARTPSIAATVAVGSYTYTSGIATNTDQSIRVLSAGTLNGSLDAVPAGNFYIGSSQTVNDSFGYSWWMSNSSGTYQSFQLFQTCDFEANSSNWKIYSSSGTINIADSDPYCLHKSFYYDGTA